MSIKKLFGNPNQNSNFLSGANQRNLFDAVESSKNVKEVYKRQQEFNPQVDYSDPATFARYGSARLYYSGAVGRILDYYPYDGSDAEQNQFYNKSLNVERHIFNNLWPRTNGYANFNSSSYIDFKGGPHTISSATTAGLFKNDGTSKRGQANVYDENIYQTEGLPDSYGTGSRQSNLRANFDSGVTVEFWLKSNGLAENANSIVFDMWNNNASGTVDMGRMTIEVLSASSASPFLFTVQSGSISGTLFQQSIGQNILSTDLDDWKHYAFVFQNSGSDFVSRLYVNGYENHTVINSNLAIGELPSKEMIGRIGSLVTVPFRADAAASTRTANTHTFTGSIDEFRYWKEARSPLNIGTDWYQQVRGGTNTDISNATLGVYYKFNEGTTGATAIDSNVLDYSGRLTNGTWTGTPSRTLSSAMLESSASTVEYKDPIIYASHPKIVELKNGLNHSGSHHDVNNNTNFYSYMPSWIMEEHDYLGNQNPEIISHVLGSYFDKIYNLIEALPTFHGLQNTSASFTPISFAQHLPQSLGLDTPNLFVESSVVNTFLNASDKSKFAGDISQTKNLIYQNLYNNLSSIYKSKGTERAVKNVLRCFYLDDSVIKFKTYADNTVYDLDTNSVQILKNKNMLLFGTSSNISSVCFLKQDPNDTSNTRGYISGSGPFNYETGYGFTMEATTRFPSFVAGYGNLNNQDIKRASLFGIYSASVESKANLKWMFDNGGADFQVYANKVDGNPKAVFFSLTSSVLPTYELTSSAFNDVYNNTDWNISVRIKPSTYPLATFVAGNTSNYTYDLVFEGINTNLGVVTDSFVLTASVSKAAGDRLVTSAKRPYVGANRTNFTGTVNYQTDALISGVRYWAKFVDSDSLLQHALDLENVGISGSFRNIAPYASSSNLPHEMLNKDTLTMHWNFTDLTSSDGSGNFFTQDVSSGSAADAASNGWLGGISGFLHKGFGYGFLSNSTAVKSKQAINTFKFIDPEQATSSDMVNILSNDDEVYGFASTVPNFYNTLEKSMYDAISEEMLKFFAGAVDFHNLIGEPVNRYRESYKAMGHLRRQFFKRVNETKEVEKYIEYYKWFDGAISNIVAQMVPAASKFTDNVLNVVESHVLERNKYKTMFPTLEFQSEDPITPMMGIREKLYQWSQNHHPLSKQSTDNPDWWRDRAERVNNPTIAAGDSTVDGARDIYRETIANDNNQKTERLVNQGEGSYLRTPYLKRKLSLPYKFDAIVESDYLTTYAPMKSIKGGVNFRHSKRIDYVYNALRPAGRINEENGNFVPENVLFAQLLSPDGTLKDLIRETRYKRGLVYGPEPHANDQLYRNRPSEKVLLNVRVQHGRDVEGYSTIDALSAFPFNIVSSSVTTGYNRRVVERVTGNIEITNLHHDVYGEDMERPAQTTFTEHVVGGHQSRHVPLNIGNDNETNRPEAWRIELGYPVGSECGNIGNMSGAIGMVGPDYPHPNAVYQSGMKPYPATASLKAPWYRDFTAKKPVNIKNIQLKIGPSGTFPTRIGNYKNTYEFIQTVGAWSNPIGFRDGPPSFTTTGSVGEVLAFKDNSNSNQATSIRTIRDIKRNTSGRFGVADYSTAYLTGAKNKSVIIQRFSHRGGIEVNTRGYQDFRSTEFSVYNAVPYRNLTVRRPAQPPTTNISNPVVNGDTTNIQVFDIHGMDYGLTPHLARHTARFGRDSMIFPQDGDRLPYDLNKSLIGYGDKKIYRSGDKLMGWWRLDRNNFETAVSGNALDSSGNGRVGTFPSGSSFRPTFSASLGPSDFIQTGSAAFTANDGVRTTAVDIGTSTLWDAVIGNNTGAGSTQKMTFAAWIYPVRAGLSNFSRILSFSADLDWYTNSAQRMGLLAYWQISGSQTAVVWNVEDSVNYNVWSHVAITYDASSNLNNPTFYINGAEVASSGPLLNSDTSISIANADMSNWFGIGANHRCTLGNLGAESTIATYAFEGNIADAAIWNTNLSSEEVTAIYNASLYEEEQGPGYSDNLDSTPEMPGFHKIHRNNMPAIGLDTETVKMQTETITEGLNNENYAKTTAVTGSNSFLLTGSTQRSNFENFFMSALTGAGGGSNNVLGGGISWSGWVKFQEDGTSFDDEETLWGFGHRNGNVPLMRLVKETESTLANGVDWYLILDTKQNSVNQPNGATNTYKWNVTDIDFSGSWNHIALVWGSPNDGTNIAQAPVGVGSDTDGTFTSTADGVTLATADSGATFYVNGMSQSYESFTSANNGHRYETRTTTRNDYKGFDLSIQTSHKDQAAFIGGKWAAGGTDNNALSSDIDEWSFWTVALDSGSIQELYNGGVPCNITGTTMYENSGTFLFDWLRFQNTDAGGSSAFVVDSDNPGTYSNSNKLVGFTNSSSWMPLANAGAANWTISADNYLTGCSAVLRVSNVTNKIYKGISKNDNFFVQHPIPRSDRQYSFFTGAIEDPDPSNGRFAGYMPIFGPQQGMYRSSSTVYEPYLVMLSESEFGYTYDSGGGHPTPPGGTVHPSYDFAILGIIKGAYTSHFNEGFKGQDFAGLNTMIYEPIEASSSMTNTLGWPTAVYSRQDLPIHAHTQTVGTAITRFIDNVTDPGDQYRNIRFFNPPNGGYGGFWGAVIGGVSSSFADGAGGHHGLQAAAETQLQGYLFNTLMLKRNGPYGYGTHAQVTRNRQHPVLRSERSSSTISIYNSARRQLEKYPLQVVSTRARPTLINYTPYDPLSEVGDSVNPEAANDSITLKVSDVNEKIMFNHPALNEISKVDPDDIVTSLDHMLLVLSKHNDYGLNWMSYTEKVFPAPRNEFVSHSRTRIGYDMQFWRDVRDRRNDLGNTVQPSIGRAAAPEFFASARTDYISQSSWPLDAQANFLTRTGSIVGSVLNLEYTASQRPSPFKGNNVNRNYLRAGPFSSSVTVPGYDPAGSGTPLQSYPLVQIALSNAAGEMQNNYSHAHFAHDAAHGGRGSKYDGQFTFINCGALYARKHMLGPFLSVGNPTGMEIMTTGNLGSSNVNEQNNFGQLLTQSVNINTGEAIWEAGNQAGILRKSGNGFKFVSKPSKPWYDNYEQFRQDIMLLAKDYVVVPEFRLSENIKDYSKFDIDDNGKFDTFEIPGTGITSVTGTFYDNYVNSGKMEYFRQQGLKTDLTAKEIKISVKAVKKWNPYKGFYPAQRTIDLVSQFSSSYNHQIQVKRVAGKSDGSDYTPAGLFPGGPARPVYQPLFMPGILYNSIKSGMAVDWPAIHGSVAKGSSKNYAHTTASFGVYNGTRAGAGHGTVRENPTNLHTWMIHATASLNDAGSRNPWLNGTPFFDTRLPFETILAPEVGFVGRDFIDMEPHPSASVDFSASLVVNNNDGFYTLMARNFFGETANFFLRGRDYSTLRSGKIIQNKVNFKSGSVYGCRLRLKRSLGNFGGDPQLQLDGNVSGTSDPLAGSTRRYYTFDRDAWGATYPVGAYDSLGGRFFDRTKGVFISGSSYELPQDPIHPWIAENFTGSISGKFADKGDITRESFTMYSRPSAFGPPISGRILTEMSSAVSASAYGIKDSLEGYNWAYTPPYYHGEAWMDLIFTPNKTEYSLEEVLTEIETQCWRVDPGPVVNMSRNTIGARGGRNGLGHAATTAFISSSYDEQCIYDGRNVNAHAMQVSASLNVFGIEKESFLQTDQFGNPTSERNQTNATRWVIKPKFETPMLNFSSSLKPASLTPSRPLFGSSSLPHGMWHQFGLLEPDKTRGIFMEMSDIPTNWLKYHYMVRDTGSIYNKFDFASNGQDMHSDMKSLADVFKFDKTPKRLGEIARRKILREAVVAIPYRNVMIGNDTNSDDLQNRVEKQFFGLEPFRVAAALAANAKTATGQSLDVAGESIRKLVRKMKKYILPPQFDFLRNPAAAPIAMYIFDFHYALDKDDLSYIWQNIAPRNYQKLRFQESSIAHELNNTELLDAEDLMQKDVQWMVFKVKQKATGDYFKHVATQIADSKTKTARQLEDISRNSLQYNLDFSENVEDDGDSNGVISENTYELQYNWPYDYISIVEGIKVEVEVLYDDKLVKTANIIAEEIDSAQNNANERTNSELPDPAEVAKVYANNQNAQKSVNMALTQLGMLDSEPQMAASNNVQSFSSAPQFGGGLSFTAGGSNNQGGNNQGGNNQGGGGQGGGNY